MGTEGSKLAQVVSDKIAAGEHLTPEAASAFEAWYTAAERLKLCVASAIEANPQATSAIDAAGAGLPAGAGVSGLAAYFGELSGAAAEVLSLLKSPLASEVALKGYGLGDLGQIAQAAQIASRLLAAAWPKMIQALSLPVVRGAVVTYIGVKGVGEAFNADTTAYRDISNTLNQFVADGKMTVEDAAKLKPSAPLSAGAIVALGVVVVGGLALYFRSKRAQ
jgi:hypothetical protein